MKNEISIGVDLGTFHTIAVSSHRNNIKIPRRSIPSIAVIVGNVAIAGIDAVQQIGISKNIITAPKLKLKTKEGDQSIIVNIIRKLVEQAIGDLQVNSRNIVMSVPPGWGLDECKTIEDSIGVSGLTARFIHEPIALLVALLDFVSKDPVHSNVTSKIMTTQKFLLCDWGAGTVDIALVEIEWLQNGYQLKCIAEKTILNHGGTDIAKDVVTSISKAVDIDKISYLLQLAWQGENIPSINLNEYKETTSIRLKIASKFVGDEIEKLLSDARIDNRENILGILYGGPLESLELSANLRVEISDKSLIKLNNILSVNSEFTNSYKNLENLRRDSLVALGASLFGARGEALPEFEYEISLRNSFGEISSKLRLIKGKNLSGIQVITPPFSGVDYFVDINQVRVVNQARHYTNVQGELKLFIRSGAVIMYRISESGVGFATIEACEAQDLPAPELFNDSRIEKITMPEKSTIFHIGD